MHNNAIKFAFIGWIFALGLLSGCGAKESETVPLLLHTTGADSVEVYGGTWSLSDFP